MLSVVAAVLLAAGSAAAKFDPAHRWQTIETPHFAIHHHEGCGELAARAALIAEEAHARLAPRVGWTPREKTRLIIADDADAAGGWATPYPYNQIQITPTPPLGEYGLGTTHHDDWLRLVITHEYTHILQLDMASRFPLTLRSIFGRLYFPNALQPQWLTEGLATFEETELTTGGRGRSPGSAMILRMAALEGPFPTLDQMAVLPDAWPAGQVPYLFGESFLRFLAERFGRGKVADLSLAYGGRPLPFLVESTGRSVLGGEYRELWGQWSAELRERCRSLERSVTARGLTPSKALTADGRFNGSAAWSPDGRRIAWLRADGREYPGIWIMDADGANQKRLVRSDFPTTSSGATLAWSPDGRRLYYTRQGVLRGTVTVNDIWAWDFDRGREIRITRGLRARDAHPSPDGRTLVARDRRARADAAGAAGSRRAAPRADGVPAAPAERPLDRPVRRAALEPRRPADRGERLDAGRRDGDPRARPRRPAAHAGRARARTRQRARLEPRGAQALLLLGRHRHLQHFRLGRGDERNHAGDQRPRRRLLPGPVPGRAPSGLHRLHRPRLRLTSNGTGVTSRAEGWRGGEVSGGGAQRARWRSAASRAT